MSEWKEYKLGELTLDGKGHYGIAAPAVDFDCSKYTYLRITDINDDGTINRQGLKSVDDVKAKEYLLKPNDIVFARTGASVGRSYFYDGKDGELVYAGFLIKFSLNPEKVCPYILKAYTHSQEYYDWIRAVDNGATRGNINAQTFASMPISLPSLEEQKRIAGVLSSLDDKIDLLNRENVTLEALAETLFRHYFIENPDPAWKEGKLGDYVDIKRGGSPRPITDYIAPSGYRWLKISDVTNIDSPYIFHTKEYIKESGLKKTVLLNEGSLVLSNSATPGIPKILCVDSCIHDGWLYFPKSSFSKYYLYLFFKFIRQDLINLGNGSIFTNLKTDILKNYVINIPDSTSLDKFESIVSPLFEKMLGNTEQVYALETQRDALLPRLMSGEVMVEK